MRFVTLCFWDVEGAVPYWFPYNSALCTLSALHFIQLSHIALVLSRKTVGQKRTGNDRKIIKTSARVHVFVAFVCLFAASVEHFFSPFLTKLFFLCIIGKKDTEKGGCKCTTRSSKN